ncbi:MAG: hypothetical protein ACOZHQ_08475 [Thermodesulfobacteriota bacterium]
MTRMAIVSRIRPRSNRAPVPVTLEEIITSLQDCTSDDGLVVQAVLELMRRGWLRAPEIHEEPFDLAANA